MSWTIGQILTLVAHSLRVTPSSQNSRYRLWVNLNIPLSTSRDKPFNKMNKLTLSSVAFGRCHVLDGPLEKCFVGIFQTSSMNIRNKTFILARESKNAATVASDVLRLHEMYTSTKEARRQATMCLTQIQEEVEEMKMGGERKGREEWEQRILFGTLLWQLLNIISTHYYI